MGDSAAFLVVQALSESNAVNTLKSFQCNYNEIEKKKVSKKILNILLEGFKSLESIEFKGNKVDKEDKQLFIEKFADKNIKILFVEETDEEGDEDYGDEDEEDEEDIDVEDIIAKLEKLKI